MQVITEKTVSVQLLAYLPAAYRKRNSLTALNMQPQPPTPLLTRGVLTTSFSFETQRWTCW
jgi:hypothetical protein